jgi:hypothetical protein
MAASAGYGGAVYAASGTSVSASNTSMTNTGDNLTYRVSNAAHRFWDDEAAVVLERDDGGGYDPVAASEYTVDYAGGLITFLVAQNPAHLMRVDYNYFTITQVAEAYEWNFGFERSLETDTAFGDEWETQVVLLGSGSASIKVHWTDGAFLTMLDDDTKVGLSLYIDYGDSLKYDALAVVESNSVTSEVGSLVDESVNFKLHRKPRYA